MSKIKVVFVEVGEVPRVGEIENTLRAMQKYVGGYIEVIQYKGYDIVCNEEAKLMNMKGNRYVRNDIIAGNFFVCANSDDGDFISLSSEEQELLIKEFSTVDSISDTEVEESIFIEFISF